jgi:2-dehydropantoate 2-reductase
VTSIAVVGPGSVGTFFAAHLAVAGHDVLACARRPFTEYVVESPQAPARAPAHVVTDPGEVPGPVDWVLVTVKAHHTPGIEPWLAKLCGPATTVVVVQNGIEGAERVAPYAGEAEVVAAVVYCAAELLEPGHVRHRQDGILILPDVPSGHRLVELFAGTPTDVRATPTYLTDAWRKLGVNVALNGITALTMRPIEVMNRPDVAEVGRALLYEVWAIARAEGADLPEAAADNLIEALKQVRDAGPTSMLQDRRAGRLTEHDALYGAVIRAGARHNLPTPLCRTFDALIAAGE